MAESEEVESAPRDLTPPPLQQPSAKERKYDRQLRLWAAAGQLALEQSHVLLVVGEQHPGSHSSVAGAETLKNLILPSIGNFTIADAATVQEADLGINFFLGPESLGRSRADGMTRLLQELNPDVTGHSVTTPISKWLTNEESLQPYNLVILCGPVDGKQLSTLSTTSLKLSIPLIYVQSVGFYSTFSIQLPPEFPIVDTHPDPETTQDLRLLKPWPELVQAVDAIRNLDAMPDHDHGHVPYILLLLHYLQQWKASHDDKSPSTFKQKTEFRDLVRSQARTSNPEGGEENYDEACAAVLKSISDPPVGSGCKEMFDMPECKNLTPTSANFWIIANAISIFYHNHGVLPLPGSLPDMKATSDTYIKLQNIYKGKARADVAEVTTTVRETERSLSKQNNQPPIPEAEVEQFCKNASHVVVLTNHNNKLLPQARLSNDPDDLIPSIQKALTNDFEDMLPIFIAFASQIDSTLAYKIFDKGDDNEEKLTFTQNVSQDIRRAEGGELHNISSLTGGMVAQEAIKLLTRQYVPVNDTCVFDGVRSKAYAFNLTR